MKRRGLFVTGTDTSVGKTVASAALLHRYGSRVPLRYWKPVQTGIEQDDDTAEVRRLSACASGVALDDGVRLPRPVSPHLAARLSGVEIRIPSLVATLDGQPSGPAWIVEGAGGVLVPLNASDLMIDLASALGLAALVVARSTLGTINHTLLTIETLRGRGVPVAGVLMIGPLNEENRSAIEGYGTIMVVGQLPILDPLDAAAIGAWAASGLDPQARLLEYLQ